MNRKSTEERARILHCLVEGNSIRATSRLMDCSKNTVTKLLVEVGEACAVYQDTHLINLPCERIQVDEIWSFVEKKNRNEDGKRNHNGDTWTFTSICADTKLVPCWLVSKRSAEDTTAFIVDIASRMKGRIQLTTDGFFPYIDAVERAFGAEVDYAMIKKSVNKEGDPSIMTRRVTGNPDPAHISTSFVERQNLLMRTNIKRFTRRTNGFSKKTENHNLAVSLHFMFYNFVRIHQTLRVTPAMAAEVSETLWSLEDVVEMSNTYWKKEDN